MRRRAGRNLTLIRATAAWVRQAFLRYHAREITHEQLRAVVDQHRGHAPEDHHGPGCGIVDSDTPDPPH